MNGISLHTPAIHAYLDRYFCEVFTAYLPLLSFGDLPDFDQGKNAFGADCGKLKLFVAELPIDSRLSQRLDGEFNSSARGFTCRRDLKSVKPEGC